MEAWVARILLERFDKVLLVMVEVAGVGLVHVCLGFELVTRDAMFIKLLGRSARVRCSTKLRVHLIDCGLH